MKLTRHKTALLRILFLSLFVSITGMKSSDIEDREKWFYDDNDDAEARALAVNEGNLEFLSSPPEKPPHELHNKFKINSESLSDGWIDLVQCHENLDKVAEAQILYHPRRTRNIKVLSSVGIERTWVEKNSVQMTDITENARICISAEVHSLYSNFDGTYSMRNGPFHRRFLDGYYPMRVTMDVELPEGELSFGAIEPVEQVGFKVDHNNQGMRVDALFVGQLNIEIYFDSAEG
jgi:hypothetical protein